MLLVLEDGHWADAPTLLLLRHLARSAGSGRLLLLVTFRDTEADVPRELAETLADLRRSDDVVRMRLAGSPGRRSPTWSAVPPAATPTPSCASSRHDPRPHRRQRLSRLRALARPGRDRDRRGHRRAMRVTRPLTELGTPESVREVVSQRLSRLAPRTTDLLELAAVAGPEFELEPVRRAAGLAEADCSPRSRRRWAAA